MGGVQVGQVPLFDIMFVFKKAFKFLLPREVHGGTSLSQTLPLTVAYSHVVGISYLDPTPFKTAGSALVAKINEVSR